MNAKKEEIIEAEFSVVDDNRNGGREEKNIWVLTGESVVDAKLIKVSLQIYGDGEELGPNHVVNCYVSQIEGVDIKNAFDWRNERHFDEIPTKEEQKKIIKDALGKHGLSGEIWLVGERYAQGHLSVLKIKKHIKGGAYVSA